MKREDRESSCNSWLADPRSSTRPTRSSQPPFRGDLLHALVSEEDQGSRRCGSLVRRRVTNKMSRLAIKPKEMKVRKSGRIKRMPQIDYHESSVSAGGSISSKEEGYFDDNPDDAPGHEQVNTIHENPRINLYHVGGLDGEGKKCCPTCRSAIHFNYNKCGDLLDVIEDLEKRLSKKIKDTRKVFMEFKDDLRSQVNLIYKLNEKQMDNLKNMEKQLTKLRGGNQSKSTSEDPEEPYYHHYDPEEPYYHYHPGGRDPLDSLVDDEHWFADEGN